jgi:hypothetical protein
LILTYAVGGMIFQVGDRLVTGGGRSPDPAANKNILFLAENAIVSIGYTGRAYLDDVPTDQWLAQLLSGEEMDGRREPKPPIRLRTGPITWWPNIGVALVLLKRNLEVAVSRLPATQRSLAPTVVLAGWQNVGRRKRDVRPLVAALAYSSSNGRYGIWQHKRYWHREPRPGGQYPSFLVAIPPRYLSTAECADLNARLGQARTIDEAEDLLVGAIREVTGRFSTVGRDCVSIVLPPPRMPRVRVRYLPIGRMTHGPLNCVMTNPLPAAFTPWVLGPKITFPPTILASTEDAVSQEVPLGQYIVSLECTGLERTPGDVAAFVLDTQTRRRAP